MGASQLAVEQRHDFESNYKDYRKYVYVYILGKIRNKTSADEITDEVIVRFLASMNRRRWEHKIESFKAYLITCARRYCHKWQLRHSVETSLDEFYEQREQEHKTPEPKAMQDHDASPRIERGIYYEELLRNLPKAITADVTDYEWQLLNMHYGKDMDAEAIARKLGKDPDSVRYKINKVLAKVRYRARKSGVAVEWLP